MVFEGNEALRAETGPGPWKVLYEPPAPLSPVGYTALHFAFHRGDAEISEEIAFQASLGAAVVDLLHGPGAEAINPTTSEWQEVRVPLGRFDVTESIDVVAFLGDLSGTVYIDDVRLVTAAKDRGPGTAVLESRDEMTPVAFGLSQNYPNPFIPETTIRFDLPSAGSAALSLFNLAGQRLATLVSGDREAGSYTLLWDGTDDAGRDLASGMYFYRLAAGDRVETRKLMLLR